MTVGSILMLLRQNNLPFGDQTAAAATIEAAFKHAIGALCSDCAKGLKPERNGTHVIEVIQGHVAHDRTCLSHPLRQMLCLETTDTSGVREP